MAEQRPPQSPSYQQKEPPRYQPKEPPPGYQQKEPPGYQQKEPPPGYKPKEPPPGYQQQEPPPGYQQQEPPPGYQQQEPPPGYQQQEPPPGYQQQEPPGYQPKEPPGYQPKEPSGYADPAPPEYTDPPCPEPKACPSLPCPPPEPDPCEPPEYSSEPPQPPTGETGEAYSASPSGPITPAQQLEKLRNNFDAGQRELQKFEPLKTSLDDLKQRIETLQKTIEGQGDAAVTYTGFYHTTETFRSALECTIPTIRCQLELTERQKACIRKAIAAVDARVAKAESDRDAQNAEVRWRENKQKKLEESLAWAKKWHDFFKTDLVKQITDQREELKKLQDLATPSKDKDQCEVWFYLSEMEAMLRSARTTEEGEACYMEGLNVATFLDCWSPKCYAAAYQYWIVAFNEADGAEKFGKSELAEAKKRAAALETLAKEAKEKRREWILKELKAQDCCGPKCP